MRCSCRGSAGERAAGVQRARGTATSSGALAARGASKRWRHREAKAYPHLRGAVASLIDGEEHVEDAVDVGEISCAEEQTLLGLLKSAIAEDHKAEGHGLSVVERDNHIKRAIAIKEDILNQIAEDERELFVSPFGPVTAPKAPPQVKFGSALQGSPGPLLGNFSADVEFWDSFSPPSTASAASCRRTPRPSTAGSPASG